MSFASIFVGIFIGAQGMTTGKIEVEGYKCIEYNEEVNND